MAKKIIADSSLCERVCKEDDIAFLQKLCTKELLANRPKIDLSRLNKRETNQAIIDNNLFTRSVVSETPLELQLKIGVSLKADYFFKGYRTTKQTIKGLEVAPDTILSLKSKTNVYCNEKFYIGFTNVVEGRLVGFSLSVVPATTGIKGKAQAILTVLSDAYYIDDASKYMDVSKIIKDMSV